MNKEIKAYISLQAKISGAYNFFINGMIAGLIYHKADFVPTDPTSLAIDFMLTCILTFAINALFCKASLKSTKTEGIFVSTNQWMNYSSRLFRHPLLFGILTGFAVSVVLFVLIASIFALFGLNTLPFGIYILAKTVLSALLGGAAVLLELYSGIHRFEASFAKK